MPATIAIAPFENLSGDPLQDYFAQGFVQDIATELSRFGTLDVLHPRAVAAAAPIDTLARYVLHGSVRRSGDIVRVAVQLVEPGQGRQVWAERYDATAAELHDVQDAICARIARTVAGHVDEARLRVARRAPLASLEAYDCWLRGLDCLRRGTIEADAEARRFFERALEIDASYARAYAGLSLSHFNEWSCDLWEKWDEKESLAYDFARRAAALDEGDAMVQVILGRSLVYRGRHDEAAHHVARALQLNPNDTDVLVHAGLCQAYLGDHEAALATAHTAMRLHPAGPPWYLLAPVGLSLFCLGRYRECLDACDGAHVTLIVDGAAFAAASAALMGDVPTAARYLGVFLDRFQDQVGFGRRAEPGEALRWLLHINPLRRREDAEHLARGLRLAGLEADPDEGRPDAVARPTPPESPPAVLRRDGDRWTAAFDDTVVHIAHQKGLLDLAQLLGRPGSEMHCLELADRPAETTGEVPVLDDRARRELGARVRELQRDIDEADAAHDLGRATRAREELDQIVEHLSGALGIGGRSRPLGSGAERARSAVTWRIRNAIRKIATVHPRLGRHLAHSIKTGTFCAYVPETPITWQL
jgi:TolB-like protein/tetratricopeptide (TPR) repeat protein